MRFVRYLIVLSILTIVSGCINPHAVYQYSGNRGSYLVKPSDTLYSIAWRYGLDYRELAQWNNISVESTIYPGQRLLLIKPTSTPVATVNTPAVKQNTQKS